MLRVSMKIWSCEGVGTPQAGRELARGGGAAMLLSALGDPAKGSIVKGERTLGPNQLYLLYYFTAP